MGQWLSLIKSELRDNKWQLKLNDVRSWTPPALLELFIVAETEDLSMFSHWITFY
jgi:hypothetical protein